MTTYVKNTTQNCVVKHCFFFFFFLQEQKSHGSNLIDEIFKKQKFFKTVTPLHVIRNISLLENNHTISIFILIVHYKILFLISIFSTSIITKYRYTFILSYNLRAESYLKETWNEEISKKEIKKKKGEKIFSFPSIRELLPFLSK